MALNVGRARRRTRKSTNEKTGSADLFHPIADRLNSKVGENTVIDLAGDEFRLSAVKEYVSTQCYGLDWAMHLPGIPVGRVSCIRGDFMSGKSTLALHLLAETQRMGGFAVYMDTEYAFDSKRTAACGVELTDDKWMLVQVDTVEKAVKSVRELIETVREMQDEGTDRLVTIVWDSVGATATKAEMEAEFGESRPGIHARLLSAALRQLTPKIAKYRICLMLVNQDKAKMDFFSVGQPATTMIAEKPIMFHSSIVLRPQRRATLTNSKKEPIGIRCTTTVAKNKLAAPFSKADFIINFANGIDNNASILGIAFQQSLVKKSGAWYSYQGKKFYERDFGKILAENPEIMEDLEAIRHSTLSTATRDMNAEEDEDVFEDETDVGQENEEAEG